MHIYYSCSSTIVRVLYSNKVAGKKDLHARGNYCNAVMLQSLHQLLVLTYGGM